LNDQTKKDVIVKYGDGKLVAIKCTPKVEGTRLERVLSALRDCIVASGQQNRFPDLVSIIERGYTVVAKIGGVLKSGSIYSAMHVWEFDFDVGFMSDGTVLEYTIVELL
jgi:hypothetical protein